MTKQCSNCGKNELKAHGLCDACYKYSRRHNGRMRPASLYTGKAPLSFCANCKERRATTKGLCNACYWYERRTGRKRPRYLIKRHCLNCGNPQIHGKGLCNPCYRFKQRTGKPRPKQLHLRYCECGNVASRRLHTPHGDIDVCEPCYRLEHSYTGGDSAQAGTFDARRMDYHT